MKSEKTGKNYTSSITVKDVARIFPLLWTIAATAAMGIFTLTILSEQYFLASLTIKEDDLCEGVLLLSPIITFVDERIEMFDFLYECASKAMQEAAEKEKEMKKEWAPDHKDAEA